MGYIGDTGVDLTSSEVEMITNLTGLATSASTQAIQKISATEFANVELGDSGGGTWGSITGTLSNQSDLQAALNAKQASDAQLTSLAALSYTGNALKVIRVNAGETDFELATPTSGTVTSVAMTVPAGLTISGSPITSSGTLAVALDTGYIIPLQTTLDGKANTALSNLASVAINTTLVSDTDNTDALGTTAIAWSDLFLGNGAVIQFNSAPSTSDVTITHSANLLTIAGGSLNLDSLTASEIVITDASKNLTSASVSTYPSLTELSYVKGLSSAVQTQINAKAPTASPTFTGEVTIPNTGLHLLDTNASHDLIIKPGSDLTADKTLTITTGDADITLNLTAVTDEYVLAYDTGTGAWRGVAPSGGGLTWTEVTGTSQAAAVNNGYIANNAALVTITLPATASVGDTVRVMGWGAGGWKVAQNASQYIKFGSSTTTTGTGGSLSSSQANDTVELVCAVTNVGWGVATPPQGNLTIV